MCVVSMPFGTSMQDQYAPCHYVRTKFTYRYATVVDLRWCRAIHSCDSCTFLQQLSDKHPAQKTAGSRQLCGAVHYGICSAIKLTPGTAAQTSPVQDQITPVQDQGVKHRNTPVQDQGVKHRNAPVQNQTIRHPTSTPQDQRHQTLSVQDQSINQQTLPVQDHITGQQTLPVQDQSTRQADQQINKENESVIRNSEVSRGEPDGESNTFLRQKTAQLQEKRQREQKQKENTHQGSEKGDHLTVNNVKSVPSPAPDVHLETKGVKKKDGLIAAAISSLKQQHDNTQAPSVKVKVSQEAGPTESTTQTQKQPSSKSQPSPVSQASSVSSKTHHKHETTTAKPATTGKTVDIPQFYFPMGAPIPTDELEATAQKIKEAFAKVEGGKLRKPDMGLLTKACGIPYYWKCPLFRYAGGEKNGHITLQSFLAAWKKLVSGCHDDAARFMRIMQQSGHSYLSEEDFLPLIQDVVDAHPGLSFLQDAPEFHSRYVQTVISRIFYCVNRSWSGRITLAEIRKSNFLQTLQLLEEEEDINQIADFFSYEHFYVIYCKFWELDKDHDLFITREDLARHNDHAISRRMVDRIFSGTVVKNLVDDKMSYKDFVWFLISEEDKRHLTSQEYWFRCMDLDGDGVISMYEMEYFYEEQVQKMESLGIETLPFEDCLCQMLDMIKPSRDGCITLMDLKKCKLTPIFFDTFFNLEKYLEHEQKDPFSNLRDHDGEEAELSDWERYAAEEYEILVAEEGANEEINYEDDFEPDDDQLSPTNGSTEILQLTEPPQRKGLGISNLAEDMFKNQENLGF